MLQTKTESYKGHVKLNRENRRKDEKGKDRRCLWDSETDEWDSLGKVRVCKVLEAPPNCVHFLRHFLAG